MIGHKANKPQHTVRRENPAALDASLVAIAQDFLKAGNAASAVKLLPYLRDDKVRLRVCVLHDGEITASRRTEITAAVKTAFNGATTETVVIRKPQKFRHADASLYGYTNTLAYPLHTGQILR